MYNQGTLDAYDIDIADYIPTGLTYGNLVTPTMTVNGNAVTIVGTGPNYEIEFLEAGDAVTVTLNFTIDANFMGTSLVNNAEIVDASAEDNGMTAGDEDSPLTNTNNGTTNELGTDNDIADDNNGGTDNSSDEDDYDPAEVNISQSFDLAIQKVITAPAPTTAYQSGGNVSFDVTVFNLSLIHI